MTGSASDVVRETDGMAAAAFLRHIVQDTFPGKVLVTVSLRARSVVTLRMIADIAPSTPVVFCHMRNMFQESLDYKARIIEELGLTDVRSPAEDSGALQDDRFHSEALWGEDPIDHMRRYTTIPLNETLKPFDCWISAVYHAPYSDAEVPRVIDDGRLLRVNPLAGWQKDDVRAYLKDRDLPFHPKAMQLPHPHVIAKPVEPGDDYHY